MRNEMFESLESREMFAVDMSAGVAGEFTIGNGNVVASVDVKVVKGEGIVGTATLTVKGIERVSLSR